MAACAICLDPLKTPVALPCGHVFCNGCLSGIVEATAGTSSSSAIHCPTCRAPVSTITPNPLVIPPYLRPYVLPPFRRIYLNSPAPSLALPDTDRASKPIVEVEKAVARLHMENAVLRQSCHAWHALANAHMNAHFQLNALVRAARDQARKSTDERNELAQKYDSLKRKFSDVDRDDLKQEAKTNQEERVLIWTETVPPAAQVEAEADLQSPPEDVPCLMRPVMGAMAGPRNSSKRTRLTPTTLYSEVPTKSATSTPAMIIPHLVSHRAASSPRFMMFDSHTKR